MTELTVDFSQPYMGGSSSTSVIPPWQVAINGRTYVLDTASGKYSRQGVQVLQQRNTNNNRDQILLPQDVWRQMFESWHQGAGQRNADREDSLPWRYFTSYGVDPWERYQVSLLNQTAKLHDLSTSDKCFLQTHNGNLVGVSGHESVWYPTVSSHTTLSFGVSAGSAISTTYDGDDIFVLTNSGYVYKMRDSSTFTPYSFSAPLMSAPMVPNSLGSSTFIAYVKDYLLIGVGNQLWDITGPQAKLIYQSPVSGWRWQGAAEGNTEIYLIGGASDHHVIHRVGIKQDGTGLDPCVVAAALPDGEIGYSIGGYLGYVFVGTSKGVRMATLTSNTYVTTGNLVLGALIPDSLPCYGFEGQDRFVWFTDSAIESGIPDDTVFPTGPVCGLSRMDLSTFTVSSSTPAYATDLVAADQTGKTVQSVCTWNGLRVFAVNGGGIYVETGDKMPGGWLVQGRVSFSVEDLKTGLYVQGKWEPLEGEIEFYLSYDSEPFDRIAQFRQQGTVRSGNIPMNGRQFSRVDTRFDLQRSSTDATKGPILTRFEVRSRPVRGRATRWTLPIFNHEELDLNGIPEARDVTEEYNTLMRLVETGVMFSLQEWGQTYQVIAVDFVWQPQKLNVAGTGWQGTYTLICEEAR